MKRHARKQHGLLIALNILLTASLFLAPFISIAEARSIQTTFSEQALSPTEASLDVPAIVEPSAPVLPEAVDPYELAMNEILTDAGLADMPGVARLEPFGGPIVSQTPQRSLPDSTVNLPTAPSPLSNLPTNLSQPFDLLSFPQPITDSEPLDLGADTPINSVTPLAVEKDNRTDLALAEGVAPSSSRDGNLESVTTLFTPIPSSQSPTLIYLPVIANNAVFTATTPEPIPNQITVTPNEGGVLLTTDGLVELIIPSGAVTTTTTIVYESLLGTPIPGNREVYNAFFDLSAHTVEGTVVTQFQEALTLIIHYPEGTFPEGQEDLAFIGYWSTVQTLWIPLPTTIYSHENKAVASTNHFTRFALLLLPDCDGIDWTPIPISVQPAFIEACNRVGLSTLGNYIISASLDNTWVAHFDNGWLVYNTNLGMAYFLEADIYDVYPAAISWLGMPTNDTDPNGPPDTYRDQLHDFRGQPYNLFDHGFIGITGGVAEAHRYYPQVISVTMNSENLGDGTVSLNFGASTDPAPDSSSLVTAEAYVFVEFEDGSGRLGNVTVYGPTSVVFSFNPPLPPVPIEETVHFRVSLDRFMYYPDDDLIGYAPCLYYDHGHMYGPLAVSQPNYQFDVNCSSGGGGGDYMPPNIQLLEVWPDGQGNLSIKVKITDDSGTIASYSLTNDFGMLSTPLTPTPQFGSDVYSAIITNIPTNQVVKFIVMASDPSGNTASISADSRSPFFGRNGLSCINPCGGWDQAVGNPVIPGTGNKVEQIEALTVFGPGESDIDITLTYNSQDSRVGIVGQSWRFPYQMDLRLVNNLLLSGAEVTYFDGRKVLYVDNGNGTYSPVTPDVHDQLFTSGSNLILKKKSLEEYEFDGSGHLIAIRDRNGNEIALSYTSDQLTRLENDAGRWVDISYNSQGFVEALDAPEGRHVEFGYDGNKLISFTNGRGKIWQYQYEERYIGALADVNGQVYEAYDYLLTATITPKGHHKNEQVYDGQGRVIKQWAGENEQRIFVYDDTANTVSVTDIYNHTTVYHYDDERRLVLVEYANGTFETYDYDADFNQIYYRDQEGREWHWTFDDQGNRLTEDGPLGWHQEWAYNSLNRVISQTAKIADERFRTTLYSYDAVGNLTQITDTLNYTSTIEYNDRGLPERIVDFNGNVTINEYEPVTGDLILTRNGAGDEIEYEYDDLGRVIKEINGRGFEFIYTYDDADNLTDINGPLGYHQGYRYDDNDNLVQEIDPNNGNVTYAYDESEMMIRATNQLSYTTVYTYNDMDKLVGLEDAEGRVWTYEYDTVYNQTASHGPEDTHTFYQYNGVNHVTDITECKSPLVGGICEDNRVTHYEYDDLDRVTTSIANFKDGQPETADTNVTTEYQYDIIGTLRVMTDTLDHPTFYTYNDRDELIRSEDAENQVTHYDYDGNGWMVQMVNARGYTTTYSYDGANRLATIVDPDDNLYQYFYDHNGNLIDEIDPLGVVTHYQYDALDQVSHTIQNYIDGEPQTAEQNVTTRFEYDTAGNLRFVFDPRGGYVTEHQYDAAHRLEFTIDNEDGITHYEYDRVNNLIHVTDANTHTTSFTYDGLNRQVAITNPEGHSVGFVYDRFGNTLSITDARGNPTTFTYDGMNRMVLMVDAMGGEWEYEYDAMGNVLCEIDANDHANNCYTYDDVYRILTSTDAEEHTDQYTYDPNGNPLTWTDGNNHTTTYTYDVLDRLATVTNAENETTTYQYDPLGNQTHLIEADGIVTHYDYDPLYRLSVVNQNDQLGQPESADVNVDTHYVYDEVGNLLTILDANEHETNFEYDGLNRQTREVDADFNEWTYEYDPVGNRTVRIDANGNRTDYTYYPDNQLHTISYALDGTSVIYLYDANNNLTEMADWLGTTTWAYDPLNRVTDVTDALGRHLGYDYDPVSNRTSLTYADGRTVQYSYYDNNWLQTVSDPEGNVTSYIRDGVGLMTHTDNPNSTMSDATYDKANRMLTLVNQQVSGAGDVISAFTYTYNEVGHRTQMVAEYSWRNPTVVTSDYTYDNLRRLVRDEDSEGVWNEYVYDRVGNRLELHTNDDASSPRPFDEQHLYYSYSDSNRLLLVMGDTHPGRPNTKRWENVAQTIYAFRHEVKAQRGKHIQIIAADNLLYMVDDLITLLEGNPPPSAGDVAVAIEAIRVQVLSDRAGGLIDNEGLANSLLVKLDRGDGANNNTSGDWQTQTYVYDPNGNRINKEFPGPQGPQVQGTDYSYDPENRLIEAQDYQMNQQGHRGDRAVTTLAYDGGGRRLVKTYDPNVGGGGHKRIEYVFNGSDPVAEYNIWNPQYENFYRGELNRIITMQHFPSGTAGQMYWYHYDGLGSTSGLTKQSGQSHHNYRYEAYGEIEHAPGNHVDPHNHYTFTGQEWDENMGLYEFFARDYDPVTGSWLSQDTYRGELINPPSLYRYQYAYNNPWNWVDKYGYNNALPEFELLKTNYERATDTNGDGKLDASEKETIAKNTCTDWIDYSDRNNTGTCSIHVSIMLNATGYNVPYISANPDGTSGSTYCYGDGNYYALTPAALRRHLTQTYGEPTKITFDELQQQGKKGIIILWPDDSYHTDLFDGTDCIGTGKGHNCWIGDKGNKTLDFWETPDKIGESRGQLAYYENALQDAKDFRDEVDQERRGLKGVLNWVVGVSDVYDDIYNDSINDSIPFWEDQVEQESENLNNLLDGSN